MTETRLLAAYILRACVSAMNVRSLVSTMRRVGEQKGVGLYVCNCATCKSAKRACFYIRIQQFVGIITCMGLVLLRANDMDREDCTCGEESSSWETQSVTLYGVFHRWGINGFNCSRLVTLDISRY